MAGGGTAAILVKHCAPILATLFVGRRPLSLPAIPEGSQCFHLGHFVPSLLLATMDPSAAMIARWNSDDQPGTVGDLCTWAGVAGALRDAILDDLGANADQHYRSLAAMDADTVKETIDDLLIGGAEGVGPPPRRRPRSCTASSARPELLLARSVRSRKKRVRRSLPRPPRQLLWEALRRDQQITSR